MEVSFVLRTIIITSGQRHDKCYLWPLWILRQAILRQAILRQAILRQAILRQAILQLRAG